jgi:CBS domain-containing protein
MGAPRYVNEVMTRPVSDNRLIGIVSRRDLSASGLPAGRRIRHAIAADP